MSSMAVKAWPEFTPGEAYSTDFVVSVLRRHLEHHNPPPRNPDEKEAWIQIIENCGHEKIVFRPHESGWGRACLHPRQETAGAFRILDGGMGLAAME